MQFIEISRLPKKGILNEQPTEAQQVEKRFIVPRFNAKRSYHVELLQ